MKIIKFFRVKMSSIGALPKGYPEGMIIGMNKDERAAMEKNPALKDCFEEVKVHPMAMATDTQVDEAKE